MKKLAYSGLFLAILGFGFVGCKKEDKTPNQTNDQKSSSSSSTEKNVRFYDNGKYLIFPTTADYDYQSEARNFGEGEFQAFLNNVKNLNYKSYLERISSLNETSLFGDDFLENILNDDMIVQIGAYLYRVDASENKVYVLPSAKASSYADLVNESKTNNNVRKFSFDEEVITLAESGAAGEAKCSDPVADATSSNSVNVTFDIPFSKTMNIRNEYKPSGILFVLRTDMIHTTAFAPNYTFYFQLDNVSWSQRCGGETQNGFSHPWKSADSKATVNSTTQRETYRHYARSKRLKSFNYKVRGRNENFTIPSSPNPYTIYFTEYTTITR